MKLPIFLWFLGVFFWGVFLFFFFYGKNDRKCETKTTRLARVPSVFLQCLSAARTWSEKDHKAEAMSLKAKLTVYTKLNYELKL